jgi:hypothetical protein
MARGAAGGPTPEEVEAETAEKDIISAFRTMLGDANEGKVQIWLKSKETRKYEYLYLKPFEKSDDTFRDELRADFVDGGDFKLVVTTIDSKYIGTEYLTLGPMPASMRPRSAPDESRSTRRDTNDNNFMMMLMKMSDESANRQMQMMMQMAKAQSDTTVAMMNLIVNMNKGAATESPSEILKNITAIQKDMMGGNSTNNFKEFAETLGAAKELLGGGGGAPAEGIAGMLQSALPLLTVMAQGGGGQGQGQAQAQGTPGQAPAHRSLPPAAQAQTPAAAANEHLPPNANDMAQTPEMAAEMDLLQLYGPLIMAIKRLVEHDRDAESLVGYIEDQIDTGAISADHVAMLVMGIQADPTQLVDVLGKFGITRADHIEVIKVAVAIYAENLDDSPPDAGQGGDAAVSAVDAAKRPAGKLQQAG